MFHVRIQSKLLLRTPDTGTGSPVPLSGTGQKGGGSKGEPPALAGTNTIL